MTELNQSRCVPCEGGVLALNKEEAQQLLSRIKEWSLSADGKSISKRFSFKGFYKTMAFVNVIAWIANQENHHPDLRVGFNYCLVQYTTHAINGLSKNDFICAAKIDALQADDALRT